MFQSTSSQAFLTPHTQISFYGLLHLATRSAEKEEPYRSPIRTMFTALVMNSADAILHHMYEAAYCPENYSPQTMLGRAVIDSLFQTTILITLDLINNATGETDIDPQTHNNEKK
jgi:hypothetical protein